jgi:isopentenyldiphosphate isomerase
MSEEYCDILDSKGQKTGEVAPYSDVHKKGLIHRAVVVILLSLDKKILLQRRALTMSAFPGLWDFSATGHVSAGETAVEAAKKETLEEIGLDFPLNSFQHLFEIDNNFVLNNGTYINNEFQDTFLVKVDNSEKLFIKNIDKKEVLDIKWASLDDFVKWTNDDSSGLIPRPEYYQKLIGVLTKIDIL